MRINFFFVHPSKYYLFKYLINELVERNYQVEIFITSKDVLEYLVKKEGWNYTNIFPQGRKIKWLPTYVSAAVNSIRTIWRIYKRTRNKNYDLFFTDDLSVINAWFKKSKSIYFTDDHADSIPEFKLLMYFASKILAPNSANLGKFERKKIGFNGYKQSAYLREKYFKPDINIVQKFNPQLTKYFLIRCVSLKATHDVGKTGLTNDLLRRIIPTLEEYGNVYLISERELPQDLEKKVIDLPPEEIHNAINYSSLFIGDSQTMCTEAGFLGTYFIWYSHFVGKVGTLHEMIDKYGLGVGIESGDEEIFIAEIKKFLNKDIDVNERALKMKKNTIDLTEFMLELVEDYNK